MKLMLSECLVTIVGVQGATEDAGRIGLVIVVCGMAGSMIGGIVLDKTHAYKVRTQARNI
jgi:hypothetical protein